MHLKTNLLALAAVAVASMTAGAVQASSLGAWAEFN